MTPATHRDLLLRRMAWLCVALVFAITSLSAFLRLSKAGLGCEPWPQCYARALDDAGAASDTAATTAARLAHRIVAGLTLVVVLLIAMTAFARPVRREAAALSLALVVLVAFLAALGRWTAGARATPAVTLGNLLGGFAMLALSCRIALAAGDPGIDGPARRRGVTAWSIAAAVVLVAQIGLGGLIGARHVALDCPQLLACDGPGAALHLAHRGGAVVAALVVLPLGVSMARRGSRAGVVMLLALAAQIALGWMLVRAALPLAAVLAHNATAAVLLAAVFAPTRDARSSGVGVPHPA